MNPSGRCTGEIRDSETLLQSSVAKRKNNTSRAWLQMKFLSDAVIYFFFGINRDQARVAKGRHLSTVGIRDLLCCLESFISFIPGREKGESAYTLRV